MTQTPERSRFDRSCWMAAPVLVAALLAGGDGLFAQPAARAEQASDQPATAPAPTLPAFAPMPPLPTAASIAEGLELSETELQALVQVLEKPSQLDEPGLYVMMRRAAALPKLSEDQWEALDQVAYVNLLQRPQDYHLRPIRMEVHVNRVTEIAAGEGLVSYSRWWPRNRPAWEFACVVPTRANPFATIQPVQVISVVAPDIQRKPDKLGPGGEDLYYVPGPKLELAGVFYKVHRRLDVEGNLRDYPVLIVWQARPLADLPAPADWTKTMAAVIIMLVAVLAIVFMRIKRQIRAIKAQPQRVPSEPPDEDREPMEDEDQQVDPLLRQAAKDYEERQGGDGT